MLLEQVGTLRYALARDVLGRIQGRILILSDFKLKKLSGTAN